MSTTALKDVVNKMKASLGIVVPDEIFDPLAREAVYDAIRYSWPDFRERTFFDCVGNGVLQRYELPGRFVTYADNKDQSPPLGILTYLAPAEFEPFIDDMESGIGASGAAKVNVCTLTFNIPITNLFTCRVWYDRRVELPTTDDDLIALPEEQLYRMSTRYLHESLSTAQIAGDASAHAYLSNQIDIQLDKSHHRSIGRRTIRLQAQAWRP